MRHSRLPPFTASVGAHAPNPGGGMGKSLPPMVCLIITALSFDGGGRKEQVAAEGGRGVAVLGQPAANRGRGQGQ